MTSSVWGAVLGAASNVGKEPRFVSLRQAASLSSPAAPPSEDKVATRELRGTHSVVMAGNEEKRTKYRVVRGREGDRLVLMKRLAG